MPHAMINGARLFHDEAGAGEPILFHHGYMSSHDAWPDVASHLQDSYRCIWMDCRGAGDSDHAPDGYTIRQFADDVIAMADHLGLSDFTYCGHSMGGVIGMELALRYPDRLSRLILVAPGPASGLEFDAAAHERGRQLWKDQSREILLLERIALAAREIPIAIHQQALERALSVSEAHVEGGYQALVDFRAELSRLTTPTLMVAGAADFLLEANLLDFLQLPNATLHVFSRVSHGIPREVPAELAAVIRDFMEHGVVTAATLGAALIEREASLTNP